MLTVSVISPEKVLFEGQASSVVAPGVDGELGILPWARAADDGARARRASA